MSSLSPNSGLRDHHQKTLTRGRKLHGTPADQFAIQVDRNRAITRYLQVLNLSIEDIGIAKVSSRQNAPKIEKIAPPLLAGEKAHVQAVFLNTGLWSQLQFPSILSSVTDHGKGPLVNFSFSKQPCSKLFSCFDPFWKSRPHQIRCLPSGENSVPDLLVPGGFFAVSFGATAIAPAPGPWGCLVLEPARWWFPPAEELPEPATSPLPESPHEGFHHRRKRSTNPCSPDSARSLVMVE